MKVSYFYSLLCSSFDRDLSFSLLFRFSYSD
jgi:hypothetical protein